MNYNAIKFPEYKSTLTIGNEIKTRIYVDIKFNRLQKFMWKFLLNIKIEDVEKENVKKWK